MQGPRDVFAGSDAAVLDEDLRKATLAALRLPREACLDLATRHSWHASAEQFYGHIRRVAQPGGTVARSLRNGPVPKALANAC